MLKTRETVDPREILIPGYWEQNVCLNIRICKGIHLKFHPLEVVGRSSKTQLQVGENSNKLT